MTTAPPTEIQVALSLSSQQRELIEQAAAQSGQSLDDFAISALVEKARQVVENGSALSKQDASAEPHYDPYSATELARKRRALELLPITNHVLLDGRALIGWQHLPPYAQEHIGKTLDALAARPASDWPRGIVEPWRPVEQLYALHTIVGVDHLLVFFRPEGADIRLLDMVLKETIDRYSTPKNEARNG